MSDVSDEHSRSPVPKQIDMMEHENRRILRVKRLDEQGRDDDLATTTPAERPSGLAAAAREHSHTFGVRAGTNMRRPPPIMSHIDVDQAKRCFDELIEQVARGEEVVITKSDQPVARLSAVTGKRQRRFGSVQGEIWMSVDFDEPLEDFREYRC